MSAFTDQLERIKQNLLAEVETETKYRAANGPKPTYSANGRMVHWTEWLTAMLKAIADLDAQIAAQAVQDDPYEIVSHGWTP